MYQYTFRLTQAKKNAKIDYTTFSKELQEGCHFINDGISYTRDGKSLQIKEIHPDHLIVVLESTESLQNPARSLSALTRYLTTHYTDVFKEYIYNKTLFAMKLIDSKCTYVEDTSYISDEELLKGMVDLLYAYSAPSASDAQLRKKTIEEMKELLRPFLKR